MDDAIPEVRDYYDAYGDAEWTRLDEDIEGQLEFDATTTTLTDYLPPTGHILDAGGGPGKYAIWLANQGYDVTLLDLSHRQLTIGNHHLEDAGVTDNVTIVQGSITDLPLPTSAYDAVCCLGGPLSHLLDADARATAVQELRRVARPQTPLGVSVLGRLGFIHLYLCTGYQLDLLPELLEHGDYDTPLLDSYGYDQPFSPTHLFRRDELATLLTNNDYTIQEITALEGLGSLFRVDAIRDNVTNRTDAEATAVHETIRETNGIDSVADLSLHFLAVAETPPPPA